MFLDLQDLTQQLNAIASRYSDDDEQEEVEVIVQPNCYGESPPCFGIEEVFDAGGHVILFMKQTQLSGGGTPGIKGVVGEPTEDYTGKPSEDEIAYMEVQAREFVWYARGNSDDPAGKPHRKELIKKYGKEELDRAIHFTDEDEQSIYNSKWEHGFNSGWLAALRWVQGAGYIKNGDFVMAKRNAFLDT